MLNIGDLRLSWSRDEHGVRLLVGAGDDRRATLALVLSLRPAASISLSRAPSTWWSLVPQPPTPRCPDAFYCCYRWSADRVAARKARRRLYEIRALLHRLATHASSLCDPALIDQVMGFRPRARFAIYSLLAGDRTGRLAQLVPSCPGALLFVVWLRDAGPARQRWIGERMARAIVGGLRLDRALDEAIAAWLAGECEPKAEQLALFPSNCQGRAERGAVLGALAAPTAAEAKQLRLLVRRAGPWVAPRLLARPLPTSIVPEDIPVEPFDNAAWFQVMSDLPPLVRWRAGRGADVFADAFVRFASRHAASIHKHGAGSLSGSILPELWDYLEASGRLPSRTCNIERVIAQCDAWHAALPGGHQEIMLPELADDPAVTQETRLPMLPLPSWTDGRNTVESVQTAGELIQHGREMKHCVATRLARILRRECAIFRASLAGSPLTVEAIRSPDGEWELGDVRGSANRPPTEDAMVVLGEWIRAVNATSDAPVEPRTETEEGRR